MKKKIQLSILEKESILKFGTSGLRGLVVAMTEEICYAYASSFITNIVKRYPLIDSIVLGHDLRPSSPNISNVLATAIEDHGFKVIYGGNLPTPALAFYSYQFNLPSIVVTGSHIPHDRNGIKFYSPDGEITKDDEKLISAAEVIIPNSISIRKLSQPNKNVELNYTRRYIDFFEPKSFSGMRIGLYEHSSVARDLIKNLLEELGIEVISLGRTNSFIPIDTEAVRKEDIINASIWANEYEFDAIFTTDGDADRPLITDENGKWLRGDIVGILTAKFLNADTVVTPVSSNTALEKSEWFNQVIRTKIGSPFVIVGMEQVDNLKKVVVGFEGNGGFLLGSDIEIERGKLDRLPTRDAVLPMLSILAMSRQLNCKISELPNLLPKRFTYSDRIQNFQTYKSILLLEQLNNNATLAATLMAPNSGIIVSIDLTDGFRATFSNEDIVHIRPSGNAPELRCYSESNTEDNAMKLCLDCLKIISEKFI